MMRPYQDLTHSPMPLMFSPFVSLSFLLLLLLCLLVLSKSSLFILSKSSGQIFDLHFACFLRFFSMSCGSVRK